MEDAISEEDSLKEKYHPDLNLLENLHYIPNTVKSLRKDWLKSTTTVFEIGDIMGNDS